MSNPQSNAKITCKDRNDQKWNSHKDEIHQIYVTEDKTLKETMIAIEQRCGLKASERKWKMKLKEWNFEKYVPANEMNFVVAKLLKRQADEGRDTVFFRGETQITTDRIENFKKRKTVKDSDALIADAVTPENITYRTPGNDVENVEFPTREIVVPKSNQELGNNSTHLPDCKDQSSTSADPKEHWRDLPRPARNLFHLTLLNDERITRAAPNKSPAVVANVLNSPALKPFRAQESASIILSDNSSENGHIGDHDEIGDSSRANLVSMERWLDPQGEESPWVLKGDIECNPILASTTSTRVENLGNLFLGKRNQKELLSNDEMESQRQLVDEVCECRNRVMSTYHSKIASSKAGTADGGTFAELLEMPSSSGPVNQEKAVDEETKVRLEKDVLLEVVKSIHHEATTRISTCPWKNDEWKDDFSLALLLLHQDRPQEALHVLLGSLAVQMLRAPSFEPGSGLDLKDRLDKICIRLHHDEGDTLFRISGSSLWLNEDEGTPWEAEPEYTADLISNTIMRATACSLRGQFEFGDYLFPVLDPSFKALDESRGGYKLIRALAERSLLHYQPRKKWKEATTDLIRAYRILHGIMLSKGTTDQITELIALLQSTLINIPMPGETERVNDRLSNVPRRPGKPLSTAGKRGGSVYSRIDTKSNTTGSRSVRYGMTYTESVETGVSFDYSALFP